MVSFPILAGHIASCHRYLTFLPLTRATRSSRSRSLTVILALLGRHRCRGVFCRGLLGVGLRLDESHLQNGDRTLGPVSRNNPLDLAHAADVGNGPLFPIRFPGAFLNAVDIQRVAT